MNIIILGGGASGLAAAISAARMGADVTVLERSDRVGRKILASGNGRCNLSNEAITNTHYHGAPAFLGEVFDALPPGEVLDFFRSIGLLTCVEDGRIYPHSLQASSVLDVLRLACERHGVHIKTQSEVMGITPARKGGYHITLSGGETLYASQVICAGGGKAAAKLGTNGSFYPLLSSLGHQVTPLYPALVQLRCRHKALPSLKGIRIKTQITLHIQGESPIREEGELLFTDYGVSGVCVFQISCHAARAIAQKKQTTLTIDFLPGYSRDDFDERFELFANEPTPNLFTGVFHKMIAQALLREANIDTATCAQMSTVQRGKLFELLHAFPLPVTGTQPFEQAQVTAGGINTRDICASTMESHLAPGLYITGELLDVDGPCGGYNLHFAWTSGILAGRHAALRSKE